jgi:hypothetical protein
MWVDVVGQGLTDDTMDIVVKGSQRTYAVPMFTSDTGLTTQVVCDPGALTLTATSTKNLDTTIVLTFLDEEGAVLAKKDAAAQINATTPPPSATAPTTTPPPAPEPVKEPELSPAVSFTPTITGSATVTQKLTAQANAPSGWTVSAYQWYRGSSAITGATASTYTATASDIGSSLTVRVIATRAGFKDSVGTSAATAKVVWNYLITVNQTKLLSKHYTVGRTAKIDKIIIHHNAGNLTINQVYNVWQTREASAHYQVQSDGQVGRLVADGNTAWHAGNWQANVTSIGIEHANNTSKAPWTVGDAALESGAKLVAELSIYYGLGRPVWNKTVYPHSAFSSTACPGELKGSQQAKYMQRAQYWYDQLSQGK